MQTSPAIAALLDPLSATQGGASGSGPASAVGSAGLGDRAASKDAADDGQFGDALAAAMAAALGVAPPAQPVVPTSPANAAEGDEQAGVARSRGLSAAFGPAMLQTAAEAMAANDVSTEGASPPAALKAAASALADGIAAVSAEPAAAQTGLIDAKAALSAPDAQTPPSPVGAPLERVALTQAVASQAPGATQAQASVKLTSVQGGDAVPPSAPAPANHSALVQHPAPAPASGGPPAEAQLQPPPPVPTATSPGPAALAASAAHPSPTVAAADAAAAPFAAAQAGASQATTAAKPAAADTAARSARARISTAPAPAEGRNAQGSAQTHAEVAQAAVAAKAEDDLPLASADDRPADPDLERPALAPAQTGAAERQAVQSAPVESPRATPQTVALLAAQIASKVEGKSTRFDVQLDPHGLGKVDVRVEISARGDVSAALTFENPHAASELRGKAGELQTALEQAGFDLSKTSLSFNSGGQGQQQQHALFDQQHQGQSSAWRGRAFTDLSDTPEAALAPVQRRAAAGGVDVRI